MKIKKLTALLMTVMISLPNVIYASQSEPATRGYVADYLVNAADFYNSGVQKTDIIKGYEDGLLHEEDGVTRAQALVMLRRAFGSFPEATEYAKKTGLPAESFNDIPDWAKSELADVFEAGIVAGTGEGTFSPNAPVTKEQLEIFCKRVYALFGTNRKDDFYAAINKLSFDKVTYDDDDKPLSVFDNLAQSASNKTLLGIVDLLGEQSSSYGMKPEHISKLRRFLDIAMDYKSRMNNGLYPVDEYIKKVDSIKTIDQLNDFMIKVMNELYTPILFDISLTLDPEGNAWYTLLFSTCESDMSKEFFEDGDAEKVKAYKDYMKRVLILSGELSENAAKDAELSFEFEHSIAESEKADINTLEENNAGEIVSFNEMKHIVPNIDVEKLVMGFGYKLDDKICISDMNMLKKLNSVYTNENIEQLKAATKMALVNIWGSVLDNKFNDEIDKFNEIYYKDDIDEDTKELRELKKTSIRAVEAVYKYMPENTTDANIGIMKRKKMLLIWRRKSNPHIRNVF